MSQELYDLWRKSSSSECTTFKEKGGKLEYSCGTLNLDANCQEDLVAFLRVLALYTERRLDCSPDQWNTLVLVNEFGISKMNELKNPFTSHPNLVIKERPPLQLVFIGSIIAVDSAYYHFYNDLNKDLTVDR